jgi:hypothetical protein
VAIKTLQKTLTGAADQVTTSDIPARQVIIQNNSANDCRVGDSSVSASRGAKLLTASNGSVNFGALQFQNINLNQIYIFGTAAGVIDVIYVE